jgi:hypothetical protein
MRYPTRSVQGSSDLWDQLNDFARRKPGLVLGGLLLGGLFLYYRRQLSSPRMSQRQLVRPGHLPRPYDMQMPSARLGAREEQITRSRQSMSTGEAERKDEVGVTGSAFDLDPESITPG